jgi:hypothetical protein
MIEDHKEILEKLSEYFNGADLSDNQRAKKRRRTDKEYNPWARYQRLQGLVLDEQIEKYIADNGTDPKKFLVEDDNEIAYLTPGTSTGDAIFAHFRYTHEISERKFNDTYRWIFAMLAHYDLIKKIRPNGAGRMGKRVLVDLQEFLKPLEDAFESLDIDLQLAAAKMQTWSVFGGKLDHLRREFGPGCFFFLYRHPNRRGHTFEELMTYDL